MDQETRQPHEWRHELLIFGLFLLVSVAVRLQSFPLSVVGWDESLYFLIAKSMRDGFMPYEVAWDHKPVGTYVIFAFAQSIFGERVMAIRLATVIAVALSAFLIKRITDLVTTDGLGGSDTTRTTETSGRGVRWMVPGIVAGLLFIVYSTANLGLTANTEHFFTPFVCAAFYLVLKLGLRTGENRRTGRVAGAAFVAGLLIGLALQVKYLVIWETIVLGVAILSLGWAQGRVPGRRPVSRAGVGLAALYSLGVLLPTFLVIAFFAWRGMWEDWLYANVTSNVRYGQLSPFSVSRWLDSLTLQASAQSVLWIAALLMPIFLLRATTNRLRWAGWLVFGWWVAGLAGASSTGRYFDHYFLQLLPAACIMTSWLVFELVRGRVGAPGGGSGRAARLGLVTLVFAQAVAMFGASAWQGAQAVRLRIQDGDAWPNDQPASVAALMRDEVRSGDYIYVVNYQPIVYHLTGARWPTRYLFPPFLTRRPAGTLDVDPLEELNRIMSLEPRFVVKRRRLTSNEWFGTLDGMLARDYALYASVENVEIFRRK